MASSTPITKKLEGLPDDWRIIFPDRSAIAQSVFVPPPSMPIKYFIKYFLYLIQKYRKSSSKEKNKHLTFIVLYNQDALLFSIHYIHIPKDKKLNISQ